MSLVVLRHCRDAGRRHTGIGPDDRAVIDSPLVAVVSDQNGHDPEPTPAALRS